MTRMGWVEQWGLPSPVLMIESRPPTAYKTLRGFQTSSFRIPGQGPKHGKVENLHPKGAGDQPVTATPELVTATPLCSYSPGSSHSSPNNFSNWPHLFLPSGPLHFSQTPLHSHPSWFIEISAQKLPIKEIF